jgi:hypothetical protein
MGTMVAIDYENGDSIMTDGLESTLVELGIQLQQQHKTFEPATEVVPSVSCNRIEAESETDKPPLLADVRDRMRSEAPAETENPWIKMASYLAKKAVDKISGAE